MYSIALFLEDLAHENIIGGMVTRVAREYGLPVETIPISVRGGHGAVAAELRKFLRDLELGKSIGIPDLLVIATDANCKGLNERIKELAGGIPEPFKDISIFAIPDPHIERWMLIDSHAFRTVFGKGCDAPNQKCDKDRYKVLLNNAIRNAGRRSILGGMEHAEALVEEMDLRTAGKNDKSLHRFLTELRNHLNRLKSSSSAPGKGVRP